MIDCWSFGLIGAFVTVIVMIFECDCNNFFIISLKDIENFYNKLHAVEIFILYIWNQVEIRLIQKWTVNRTVGPGDRRALILYDEQKNYDIVNWK